MFACLPLGDEWDYVILSLVRSIPVYEIDRAPSIGWCKRNMGFIIDHHQMNVALTRARLGLIIIGKYSTIVTRFNDKTLEELICCTRFSRAGQCCWV